MKNEVGSCPKLDSLRTVFAVYIYAIIAIINNSISAIQNVVSIYNKDESFHKQQFYLINPNETAWNHTANVHSGTTILNNEFKFWGITFPYMQ